MNPRQYFESLSLECEALKNRVRSFISNRDWLTDGEWKETVLRTMLRRNLPASMAVGRGFILTPDGASNQIDVLVFDREKPVPFKEGDLAFVTPDTAKVVIEVKTRISSRNLDAAIRHLADNAELCRVHLGRQIVFGLFAYENDSISSQRILETIAGASQGNDRRIIDFAAVGADHFVRYWEMDPLDRSRVPYRRWHAYELPKLAPGYFVHNVIAAVAPHAVDANSFVWFPIEGKESSIAGEIPFTAS